MVPAMKRLLIEGAELYNQDSNSIDRLMLYVDTNLKTLHDELNEENFSRVLEIVWDSLSDILNEIIQSNLEKRRPPSFFQNLHKTLDLMLGSFKSPDQCSNCDTLKRTEQLLKMNGLETNDLIHQAHLDLHQEYRGLRESKYGVLSVRAKFNGNNLVIEVINARNLIAMDSNGRFLGGKLSKKKLKSVFLGGSDSFVRIHLLPEEKFTNVTKPKTHTHNNNLFPLFDEKFTL